MGGKQRLGGIFDEPCAPSNSSTTSSEELTSSPPPHISSQPEQSLLMQHFRRGQNLQQSNSSSMLINGNNTCQTNTTFSVGSADEPYEFYWSDNEKASSISSYDDAGDKEQSLPREIAPGMQMRPNTLRFVIPPPFTNSIFYLSVLHNRKRLNHGGILIFKNNKMVLMSTNS